MICCDVNVVLAALRPGHEHHVAARSEITRLRSAGTTIGIPDFVASSVVRLMTNGRIFPDPTSPADSVLRVDRLLTPPGVLVTGSPGVWERFTELVADMLLRANDIPDAALAAICLENRAELLTFDRGFARFEGLRWRIPA